MSNDTYRVLAEGCYVSNNSRITGLNNNDLIIGTSGCGKTLGYVLPNIFLGNESMIISDTKGYLLDQTGANLEGMGYKIAHIDFTDLMHSPYGYNPLDYIGYDETTGRCNEQDILTVAAAIAPTNSHQEPYWEMMARMFLECLIAYTLECLPNDERNLNSVVDLFRVMGNQPKVFDQLFQELKQLDPNSFAVSRYEMFKSVSGSDRTYASILGALSEKLSVLSFDGARRLFNNPDKVDFESLCEEKTAVFLTVSDNDDAMYKLANLLYAQALNRLCSYADSQPTHALSIPVRFYLDDFASTVEIPNFDKIVSTVRSRNISVSIILQSINQLESIYGHARAMTILNNCDHLLYLGGMDIETSRYIAVKADKYVSSVLNMPLDDALLFTRGQIPKQVRKIQYGELSELMEKLNIEYPEHQEDREIEIER